MSRIIVLVLTVALAVPCAMLAADDKPAPADDPIAAELGKAKNDFQAAAARASEKMVAAFADQRKKLENNTRLKVEQQIEAIKQLDEERKDFEADNTDMPVSPAMKAATGDYQGAIKAAREKCERAFDRAANEYRKPPRKDLTSAGAVLEEKKSFFKAFDHSGPTLADLLTKDSQWEGRKSIPSKTPDNADVPFEMKVTERTGNKFKGVVTAGGKRPWNVDGEVWGNHLSFTSEQGEGVQFSYKGKLKGRTIELTFQFQRVAVGGQEVTGTATLSPHKGK
jgi:hypothetical protein